MTHIRDNSKGIPKRRRRDSEVLQFAEEWFKSEIPWHIDAIGRTQSPRELDDAYKQSVACWLRPWQRLRAKSRPERWGFFWTRDLQRWSQLRTKLWRKWRQHGDIGALARYKRVNRFIKRTVRANRRNSFAEFVHTIDEGDSTRAVGILGRVLKAKKRNVLENAPGQQRIRPADFTEFVANQHPRRTGEVVPKCRTFVVNEEWLSDLQRAVERAPANKAVGEDELFSEALRVVPELGARWLEAVWRKCGSKGWLPSLLARSNLCPLLKKEPADQPSNWRAIALLSHARKVVEKVLDARLRRVYNFNAAQCGFREGRSVDTEILRAVRALRGGCKYVCVLDFAQAYASVPRGDVVRKVRQQFDADFAAMVETLLTPTKVCTIADETAVEREMLRGVPEGSPLSPPCSTSSLIR